MDRIVSRMMHVICCTFSIELRKIISVANLLFFIDIGMANS